MSVDIVIGALQLVEGAWPASAFDEWFLSTIQVCHRYPSPPRSIAQARVRALRWNRPFGFPLRPCRRCPAAVTFKADQIDLAVDRHVPLCSNFAGVITVTRLCDRAVRGLLRDGV